MENQKNNINSHFHAWGMLLCEEYLHFSNKEDSRDKDKRCDKEQTLAHEFSSDSFLSLLYCVRDSGMQAMSER